MSMAKILPPFPEELIGYLRCMTSCSGGYMGAMTKAYEWIEDLYSCAHNALPVGYTCTFKYTENGELFRTFRDDEEELHRHMVECLVTTIESYSPVVPVFLHALDEKTFEHLLRQRDSLYYALSDLRDAIQTNSTVMVNTTIVRAAYVMADVRREGPPLFNGHNEEPE